MNQYDGDTFLLEQFREFYSEVVRLKRRVSLDVWIYEDEAPEETAEDAAAEHSPSAVWQRLLTLLERQSLTARRRGGEFGESFYREAQYVMAALADETFLHLDWRGSQSWGSNLLESRLFQTHRAGDRVFERLDEILAGRDPVHIDLAKVYLLDLALGFQGRYRGQSEGPRQLAAYRQELLEFISEREPEFREGVRQIFPDAYASTLDQGSGIQLPHLQTWRWVAIGALALWVGLAGWAWYALTIDLRPIANRIINAF